MRPETETKTLEIELNSTLEMPLHYLKTFEPTTTIKKEQEIRGSHFLTRQKPLVVVSFRFVGHTRLARVLHVAAAADSVARREPTASGGRYQFLPGIDTWPK